MSPDTNETSNELNFQKGMRRGGDTKRRSRFISKELFERYKQKYGEEATMKRFGSSKEENTQDNNTENSEQQETPEQQEQPQNNKKGFFSKLRKIKIPAIKKPKLNWLKKKDSEPTSIPPGKVFSEILMLVAFGIHLIDVLVLGASIDPVQIQIRVFMYLALVALTIIITRSYNDLPYALKKYGLVAAIPTIFIPLIAWLISLINLSPDLHDKIAGFALLLPIYSFYLFRQKDLDYSLIGKKPGQRFLSSFFLPSGWLRWWIGILVVILVSEFLVASAFIAGDISEAAGVTGTGFDSAQVISGAVQIITSPFEKIGSWFKRTIPNVLPGNTTFPFLNETMGAYYSGRVEENRELTGVFIRDLRSMGTYYENQQVELFATLQMRSFVDEINMTTYCYARDTRNTSRIIPGTTEPKELKNIYRHDSRAVRCLFEPGQLTTGSYDVTFMIEFNFETWAYITLTFMDREFLTSLNLNNVDITRRYNIVPRIRTIFTNGPVQLGMEDGMEMPLALTTQGDSNFIPLGVTIDERVQQGASRGEIKQVNSFQIRAPPEFLIEEDKSCAIPGGGKLQTTIDEETDYLIHTFDVSKIPGQYLTVSCIAEITSSGARTILNDPSGKRDVTIAGSVTYDYVLSRTRNIVVRPLIG